MIFLFFFLFIKHFIQSILITEYFSVLLYWWLVWSKRVLPSPVMHCNCSDKQRRICVYILNQTAPQKAQSADINHCGCEADNQGVKHFLLDGTFLTGSKLRKHPAISSQIRRHTQIHRQNSHTGSFSQDSAHAFLRVIGCMSGIERAGWPQCSFFIF